MKPETIKIDEVEYVRKDSLNERAKSLDGLDYVICRTQSAGVFAGYLSKREGQEVTLCQARRLWYWKGAASLSQAAEEGFSAPQGCKFPQEVQEVLLLQAIEILQCSEKTRLCIKSIQPWKA